MLFVDLVATSAAVAATRSRKAKIEAIAATLRRAEPGDVAIVVGYLSGKLRQRRTGIGWASLQDLPPPADVPTLTVVEVDAAFGRAEGLSGAGSVAARRAELAALLGRATADEQQMLVLLIGGELRQGAQAGVMADAIATAAGVPLAVVRRAAMLAGDLPTIAEAALTDGEEALSAFGLRVGTPVQPMLASSAPSIGDALAPLSEGAAVEWKLDGVRVQIHRDGDEVEVFTRSLDRITARVPEVVAAAVALPVRRAILDGEALALRDDGRPRSFQETGSRVASHTDVEGPRGGTPLTPFVFDVLHVDGDDLIDEPIRARYAVLDRILPEAQRIPRMLAPDGPADLEAATAFADDALARGHEGVMVKALGSPYEAGRRGKGWIKVKPHHTLDLVVLAVEWGHGRRQGWLSNLHLGALDASTGGFVMLGKTFKGMTDEMLAWQTQRFLELETSRDRGTVHVRPEQVVEIAFDGIQTSPRYPGGVALRFARVVRYRDDKRADEADTIETVLSLRG